MSDYLSSLAARSLRREPACQPRRAQMFEPPRETPDSPFVEEVQQELPATETFERDAAEAPTAPRAPRAPAVYEREQDTGNEPRTQALDHPALVPPQVEGEVPGPDSHASPRSTEAPATTRPTSSTSGTLQTEAPGESRAVKALPQTPPATPSLSADVHAEGLSDTGRRPLPSRRSSSNSETQTTPPSDSEAALTVRPSSRQAPESTLGAEVFDEESREQAPAVLRRESAESKGALTVAEVEVVPQPPSRTPKAAPSTDVRPLTQVRPVPAQSVTPNIPAREANTQTQPPTIEVTIGRIEVRAVTPPAPPPQPRQRQSPPKMSLDDYLRAQSGGRS
jgi:hypothetical protein